jgi:hypothetical protein
MDYNACHKAWNSFPALQRHANLDPAILPAIVRNEVSHLGLMGAKLLLPEKLLLSLIAKPHVEFRA